jgi:hypothetical protein
MPKGCSNKTGATEAAKKKPSTACKKTEERCPKEDEVRVVELIEVVEHKGKTTTQRANGRRQYVNLDSTVDSENPHSEYGRKIRLKARVEWLAGDKSRSLTGKKVYWRIEPNKSNKAGLKDKAKESFSSEGSGTQRMEKTTNKEGWTDVVVFYVSQYGGDKFDVFATHSSDHKGGLRAGAYWVWRYLWYEVDTMKKSGGGELTMDHTKLAMVYEPAFVEIEFQGNDNKPNNKKNLQTSELHAFANKYFGAERSPFQAHEVAIDHQADKEETSDKFEMKKAVESGLIDMYYTYDGGKTWLKKAQYKSGASWTEFDKNKVTLVNTTSKVYKGVKVDFSSGPVAPSNGSPVEVRITYVKAKEWSGDGANQPHAMIAMGYWYDTETVAEAKKRTLGTMAHELGHLLGMVPKAQSTHIDTGTGDHCNDTTCVMYGTNTKTRGNKFCEVCLETLRAVDLTAYKGAFTHTKGSEA